MSHKTVLTGNHFMHGDHACAEGALAANCQFFGGYPITPASEVAEVLGSTEKAIKSLIHRARESLRAWLAPMLQEELA